MLLSLSTQAVSLVLLSAMWVIILAVFVCLAISTNNARKAAQSLKESLGEEQAVALNEWGHHVFLDRRFVQAVGKLATSVSHLWRSACAGAIVTGIAALVTILQLILTLLNPSA